jgi:acyl-coenzyme A synthetase/AMP-(fatty) acid ligase
MVADASVIPIPDEAAGELPRAYIVKSQNFKNEDDEIFKQKMHSYVNGSFPQYKHLSGGIELVDSLPKTPSGKTQRMVLKLRARASVEANKRAIETQQKAAPSAVRIIEFDSDEEDDDA